MSAIPNGCASPTTEIREFKPELLINAVTLKYTIPVFKEVIPYLPKECIISDIASVKTDLKDFYESTGMRYVSTHPMFGPTFANLQQLSEENAIIISEGDYMGRIFFKDLYQKLRRWLTHCLSPLSLRLCLQLS